MKFNPEDKGIITELERMVGTVKSCFLAARGWEYEVRYFHAGKAEMTYFFESELEAVK